MKSKNCLIACQQDAQFQLNNENRLHEHNLEACNGDPTCIANENARDAAVIATIQAQLAQCQNNCHQQGGGSSGP
ncbi:MAG: hypothetical protein HY076_07735 [Candidatus Eisenbacteria bacterium]|uniref:Uncharacterized protein n=1 Tax=Eiseniibacteriota bacterium TaxID=2212470 RepID=A0A9D6LCF2_UNCEI|nr:hypothetical protein [Candidatus Eisenbacteria bacterium]